MLSALQIRIFFKEKKSNLGLLNGLHSLSFLAFFVCVLPVFPHLGLTLPFALLLLFPPSDFSPTVKTSAEEDTQAAGRPRHHAS